MHQHSIAGILKSTWISLSLFLFLFATVNSSSNQPNIIFILADCMGWNDVSYNGMNDIKTPNIDSLGADGVILNQYYSQPVCTASRSAIMTALYPIRTGLQSLPLLHGQPGGIPLDLTLLPQHLKNLGYSTKAVGKWHLGFHKKEFLPVNRGFDSHFGYWGGTIDYYQYTSTETVTSSNVFNKPTSVTNESLIFKGYELYDNMKPVRGLAGEYLTEVLTKKATQIIKSHNKTKPLFLYFAQVSIHAPSEVRPLQPPRKYTKRFSYIRSSQRRKFAGELTALDESVGDVMEALYDAKMLNNTIVIFSSDNGNPGNTIFHNAGSNYPLRGAKNSSFEGGVRVPCLVWSPLLKNKSRVSNDIMHITDWLPTFYRAGGGDVRNLGKIDGIDQWDMIINQKPTNRKELLVNIDPVFNASGLRVGNYKLIYGRDYDMNNNNRFRPTGRITFTPNVSYRNKVKNVLWTFYGRYHEHKKLEAEVKPVDCGGENLVYNSYECIDSPCLYDIARDPCEYTDVSQYYPEKAKELLEKLEKYRTEMVPVQQRIIDYNSDPSMHCGLWTNWLDPCEEQTATCHCDTIYF